MGEPYTLTKEHADRMNVVVLGRFLEKHPDCDIVRQEHDSAKRQVDLLQKRRKKHVTGRQQCPDRNKGQTHFAIQDSIGPTYRCLYCLADMSG